MKKNLLLLAILLILTTACSKDDKSTEQTFFVNVYTSTSEKKVFQRTAQDRRLYPYQNW